MRRTCPVCSGVFVFEPVRDHYADDGGRVVAVRCMGSCSTQAIVDAIAPTVAEVEAEHERELIERERAEAEARRQAHITACSFDDENEQSDAPKWWADGFIPSERLTLLYGSDGSRKSFASTGLSIAIAAGVPEWCGLAIRQGKVLQIGLEMTPADRRRYRRGLASGLGVDLKEIESRTLFRYPHALRLDDDESVAQLDEYIGSLQPDVVTLDSLSKTYMAGRGNAENDAAVMGPIMNVLESITRNHHTAVVLLHHESADGLPRGSGVIRSVPDHIVRVTCAAKRDDAPITFTRYKSRAGGFETMRVRLVGNNASDESLPLRFEPVVDEPKAKEQGARTKRQTAIVKLVRGASGLSSNAIVDEVDGSKNDVLADIEILKADGVIARNERGLWIASEGT